MAEFDMKVKKKENHTGIPTRLKERMEQSTGLSFDDVRVNYNSSLPARLDALGYTKGNRVEIAPGQERQLPHELGHVVQQKLGIVRANARHSTGEAMNTDAALERQADEIGAGKRIGISRGMGVNVVQRQRISKKSGENRETVRGFFESMRKEGAENLNLYSYIASDGLGDAGQLKLLYDEILSQKGTLKIAKEVRMLCVYDLANYINGAIKKLCAAKTFDNLIPIYMKICETAGSRKETIQKMLNIDDSNIKFNSKLDDAWMQEMQDCLGNMPNQKYGYFLSCDDNIRENAFPQFKLGASDWEIEYPMPDAQFGVGNGHVLKIKEMGEKSDLHAGDVAEEGIGYGIPNTLVREDSSKADLAENFIRSKLGDVKPDELLNNAWIVSVKNYTYQNSSINSKFNNDSFPDENIENIIKTAHNSGAKLIIFAGMPNLSNKLIDDCTKTGISIICDKIENETLKDLMAKVKNGTILSGGEGLFAESLASPENNNNAAILAGRYRFQYYEIANALLTIGPFTEYTNGSKVNMRDEGKKYRIFKYVDSQGEKAYYYYQGEKFRKILETAQGVEKTLDQVMGSNGKLQYSQNLSALYLPLYCNGKETDLKMEMPGVFGGDIKQVLMVFRALKKNLVPDSWFRLMDASGS